MGIITRDQLANMLRAWKPSRQRWVNRKWGIYIDGEHISLSNVRVYHSEGIAKGKLVNAVIGLYCDKKERERIKKLIDELMEMKIIEIKQI